ncbi:MAG: hypothetical protein B7X57_01500 [Erythrobacter sp. 34-65-8]|nr:MAG: hypothetical protein B7X57_01500 [Erythrobacter sp. 34-65-8]
MRGACTVLVAALAIALAGCSAESAGAISFGAMSHDDHLRCAAQISSYDRLMASGEAERDPQIVSKSLVALMTHLNAYAIPQGIGEPEAFAALNQLRDELLGSVQPGELRAAVVACIESAEKSGV